MLAASELLKGMIEGRDGGRAATWTVWHGGAEGQWSLPSLWHCVRWRDSGDRSFAEYGGGNGGAAGRTSRAPAGQCSDVGRLPCPCGGETTRPCIAAGDANRGATPTPVARTPTAEHM